MDGLTPRNSPKSPFSGLPGPEIPRAPYKGPGLRGERGGGSQRSFRLVHQGLRPCMHPPCWFAHPGGCR